MSEQELQNKIKAEINVEVTNKANELIEYIREVKKRTWKPVSTAETWDIWVDHPELAAEVDYIAVHILPYWEGFLRIAAKISQQTDCHY